MLTRLRTWGCIASRADWGYRVWSRRGYHSRLPQCTIYGMYVVFLFSKPINVIRASFFLVRAMDVNASNYGIQLRRPVVRL